MGGEQVRGHSLIHGGSDIATGGGTVVIAVKVGGDRGLTVRCVGRWGEECLSGWGGPWLPPSELSPHTFAGRGPLTPRPPPCLSASSGCCRLAQGTTWLACWAGARPATTTPSSRRSWRSWREPAPRCWTGECAAWPLGPLCSAGALGNHRPSAVTCLKQFHLSEQDFFLPMGFIW